MSDASSSMPSDRLVRIAIVCALVGLTGVLIFLWRGFDAFSVGIGVFFGMPLVLIAIVTYLVAVFRDLRRRGAL